MSYWPVDSSLTRDFFIDLLFLHKAANKQSYCLELHLQKRFWSKNRVSLVPTWTLFETLFTSSMFLKKNTNVVSDTSEQLRDKSRRVTENVWSLSILMVNLVLRPFWYKTLHTASEMNSTNLFTCLWKSFRIIQIYFKKSELQLDPLLAKLVSHVTGKSNNFSTKLKVIEITVCVKCEDD